MKVTIDPVEMIGTLCSRCGSPSGIGRDWDYCAVCDKTLCPDCMADGCCGNRPAESGLEADTGHPEPEWE